MNYINIGIVVTAVLSIIFILLQDRSSGTGGVFGGDTGGFYQQRRGFERIIFSATVISIIAFVVFSLLNITSFGGREAAKPQDINQELNVTPEILEVETEGGDVQVTPLPVNPPSAE